MAALCLRKLGRPVTVLERVSFPRYQIGESLLPGTLAILERLGVKDRVEQARFPKKRAATFLWGDRRGPLTFSFATPKTAPWVHDHAYQVNRAEFDKLLLDAASDAGAGVFQNHQVTDIDSSEASDDVQVHWKNGTEPQQIACSFAVDATGRAGITANKYGLRRYDDYYRNLALWSYFRGGRRLSGALEGNILSIAFEDGWIWIIPQKDDAYSVGVVTGVESNERIRELGTDGFYAQSLARAQQAQDLLKGAEQTAPVRVTLDWSYDAGRYSHGRTFLCGDAACFIDPLFSQGVHLAIYSAVQAAAAIDHLLDNPEDSHRVRAWYDRAYREAYQRYYRFVAAFYSAHPGDSAFWCNRRLKQGDPRLGAGADTLTALWAHGEEGLSEEFDPSQLAHRRIAWASRRSRQFGSMKNVRWTAKTVCLHQSFGVHPTTFRLESKTVLCTDEHGPISMFSASEEQRRLFNGLRDEPIPYATLRAKLRSTKPAAPAPWILDTLFDEGLLEGFDASGTRVAVESMPRFGGVGGDDDLS